MVAFVLLATALMLGGVVAILLPLLRSRPDGSAPARWAALGAGGLLIAGSVGLYATWSNWPWHAAAPGGSPEGMVAQLARRLEREPDDLSGWLMLGRSYTVLQEYPLAARAFERAARLSGGRNVDALVGEAEALALGDETQLDGRAGQLIERALTLAPQSGKALFLGAAIALRRGDLSLARARFAKLLTMSPPESVRPLLEQQISAIDEKLAGSAAAGPAASGALASSTGAAPPAAASPPRSAPAAAAGAPQPPPGGPEVRVNVSLGAVAATPEGAPLFVFVRDPQHPGPPLAVKRLQSRFPQSVSLGAGDSVIPGRMFSAGQSVQVVARIARSGNPVGAHGDPFGEVTYRVGRDGPVSLVIDRVTP